MKARNFVESVFVWVSDEIGGEGLFFAILTGPGRIWLHHADEQTGWRNVAIRAVRRGQ